MKASEVIEELRRQIETYGDLEVYIPYSTSHFSSTNEETASFIRFKSRGATRIPCFKIYGEGSR